MAHEHLVQWGRGAFDKGLSLAHIENYLLKRGLKKQEALKALHEITSFEHKVHNEIASARKMLMVILVIFLSVISGAMLLYYAGVLKVK